MGILGWLGDNWFDLLQTVAITTGLFATVYNLRADRRERMVQTQLALTTGHREIWSKVVENPALARLLDPSSLSCMKCREIVKIYLVLLLSVYKWGGCQ